MNVEHVKNRALVFDLGGVLIDWNPRHLYSKLLEGPEAVERFLDEIGFAEWNAEQDRGRPFSEGVAELSRRFPHYERFIRAYDERWEETLGGVIQPTVDLLRSLKEAGYPLYALTNWSAKKFSLVRGRYEFLNWFQAILVSGEVNLAKPDPRIYHLFLTQVGRTAGECVYIDDSASNIATAHELGFTAIQYESPEQLESELRRIGLLNRPSSEQ